MSSTSSTTSTASTTPTSTAPTRAEGPDPDRAHRRRFARRTWRGRLRRARPVLLLLLGIAAAAGVAWLFLVSSVFAATRVEVVGATDLPRSEVVTTAAVPLGGPLARVDLEAVESRVAGLPSLDEVRVSRGWPDAVRVTVTDRVPVAALATGGGWRLVDGDGVVWGRSATPPSDLPVVRAPRGVRRAAVLEAVRVVAALPGALTSRLEVVEVRTIDQVSLLLRGGPTVVWGSAERSALKAEVLASLLVSDEALLVDGEPAGTVDVSVPSQPTVRR